MIDLRFVPIGTPLQPKSRYIASPFQISFPRMLDDLERELGHLSGKDIIIAADMDIGQIRNDGWPRSEASPRTPGIRLSFTSRHGPLRYECATYAHWHGNLRAISLTLTAQRAMERYGAVRSGQQYAGWTSLPPGRTSIVLDAFPTVEDAAKFLRRKSSEFVLSDDPAKVASIIADPDLLKEHYRCAANLTHPDRPHGSAAEFSKVNAAKQMIEAEQARKPNK